MPHCCLLFFYRETIFQIYIFEVQSNVSISKSNWFKYTSNTGNYWPEITLMRDKFFFTTWGFYFDLIKRDLYGSRIIPSAFSVCLIDCFSELTCSEIGLYQRENAFLKNNDFSRIQRKKTTTWSVSENLHS